jgi:hypothetical protein
VSHLVLAGTNMHMQIKLSQNKMKEQTVPIQTFTHIIDHAKKSQFS